MKFFFLIALGFLIHSDLLVASSGSGDSCKQYPELCVEEACRKLPTILCNDEKELTSLLDSCRGNFDGSCLSVVCKWAGSSRCNELIEVKQVAQMCRNNRSGSCVDLICRRIGSLKCNDLSELESIAKRCAIPMP